MTNKEVIEMFKRMEDKFDDYCLNQNTINNQVIENKINIKNQGATHKNLTIILGVCTGLGIIISRIFP